MSFRHQVLAAAIAAIAMGSEIATPETSTTGRAIAWGRVVSKDFKETVIRISGELLIDPDHLMSVMAFETGERFAPDIRNKKSGATGLIQFMPQTAVALGTTVEALARMSAVEQLELVDAYLKRFKGKLHTVSDAYAAVIWPTAVGKPETFVLFRAPSPQYEQNAGLDANGDGAVTKGEAAQKVEAMNMKGNRDGYLG